MPTLVVHFFYILVQSTTALLSFSIATRFLGGNDIATWAVGAAIFGYVSLLDAGTSMIVQRNVASRRADMVEDAEIIAKTVFVALLGIGLVVFVMATAAGAIVYVSMAGAMMTRVAVNVFGVVVIARGGLISERTCRMSASLVLLFSQYALLAAGAGTSALGISILLSAATFLGLLVIQSDNVRRILLHGRVMPSKIKEYREHHLNWIFSSLPSLFIYNFQVVALKWWSTAEAVAVFSAAHLLYFGSISLFQITRTLSSVVISKHHYSASAERNKAILANLSMNAILVAVALVLVSVLLLPVGRLLFPTLSFEEYWPVFAIYGFFLVLEAAQNALADALNAAGETDFKLVNTSSAVVNVAACYFLVPPFQMAGAVAAICGAQLVTANWFNVRKAIRVFGLAPGQVLLTTARAMLVYAVLVSGHWFARHIGEQIGNVFDAVLVVGILIVSTIYMLPRALAIVEEYRLIKS